MGGLVVASKHFPKIQVLKDWWVSPGRDTTVCHTALSSLIPLLQSAGKEQVCSPQGEIKHPGQMSVQTHVISAETLQTGFDPFHFMQKTVELGQS